MERPGSAEGAWAALLGRQHPQAREFCPGVNNRPYVCETGHCCGESGCCTYYYELWWFWLLWTILILLSCCCAFRHRRAKLRLQQQQRQREINLIAYHGACHYPPSSGDLRLLASFKLPAYEEVAQRPGTPPPPYSPGSPSLSPGSSGGCSSCSCGCSCASSPSSSSLSAPGTDETDPEPGPGTGGGSTGRDYGSSSTGTGASWDLPLPEELPARGGPPKQAPPDLCEAEGHRCSNTEGGEGGAGRAVPGGCPGRHRRLTGDSGIEVGRGAEEEEGEPEGCGGAGGGGGPDSPVLPV
ncbi:WW domain-binding protein 1 [Melozone crissalis]|uniref:WW domain-binding protein 1 n=1 Tax=Melozone crissalis TaxID=40204 RepID=UPI0023DAF52D|nr:WW domain-binding protein 1 [Melozone crissalis]